MSKRLTCTLVATVATAALALGAGCALAADSPSGSSAPAPASQSLDDFLTWHGITLYGAVDVNVVDETHGVANSSTSPPVSQYLITKNSNTNTATIGANGISNSFVGLRGIEPIGGGWSALFRIESGFDPLTGRLSDGTDSIVAQNGLTTAKQGTTEADSSRAGQPFNQAAYFGVTHPVYGALTFGRQNSIMADGVVAYDPQQQAYAFSIIGYSGVAGGAGSTEDYRLDNTVKYAGHVGPVNFGGMIQASGALGSNDTAYGANVGLKGKIFSVDAYWMQKNDAVSAASLTAAQMTTVKDPSNSIAATISDDTARAIMGKANLNRLQLYAAFEQITYRNPKNPVEDGAVSVGDYVLAVVNNTAYDREKTLNIAWGGARYAVTPKLDIAGAIYHYRQDAYAANGCATAIAASCSGEEWVFSLSGIYHLTSYLDGYAGVMHSAVSGGLDYGYLHDNTADPTVGLRLRF
jgi:predicted porin